MLGNPLEIHQSLFCLLRTLAVLLNPRSGVGDNQALTAPLFFLMHPLSKLLRYASAYRRDFKLAAL
jgi:hypothetical protein